MQTSLLGLLMASSGYETRGPLKGKNLVVYKFLNTSVLGEKRGETECCSKIILGFFFQYFLYSSGILYQFRHKVVKMGDAKSHRYFQNVTCNQFSKTY